MLPSFRLIQLQNINTYFIVLTDFLWFSIFQKTEQSIINVTKAFLFLKKFDYIKETR